MPYWWVRSSGAPLYINCPILTPFIWPLCELQRLYDLINGWTSNAGLQYCSRWVGRGVRPPSTPHVTPSTDIHNKSSRDIIWSVVPNALLLEVWYQSVRDNFKPLRTDFRPVNTEYWILISDLRELISGMNQSPKGNMWSVIPIALLCMVVNWSERKQGSRPEGDRVL